MAEDIFAPYRKTPPVPTGGDEPPKESNEYSAFGAKDKNLRLDIRCAAPLAHMPSYNVLHNVTYDRPYGTNCILTYGMLLVFVRGKNLQKMVFAIANHLAEYIQEFDPKRWPKPTAADAPFIESIEIKIKEGGSPDDETKH